MKKFAWISDRNYTEAPGQEGNDEFLEQDNEDDSSDLTQDMIEKMCWAVKFEIDSGSKPQTAWAKKPKRIKIHSWDRLKVLH